MVVSVSQVSAHVERAPRPVPRPDRRFYSSNVAFGRFGMRWFKPVLMPGEHAHGHIELNWLTAGHMDYLIDSHPVQLPAGRLLMFWAGIPHRAVGVSRGQNNDALQCNVYLPLDDFLHMPRTGKLLDTMMGGGVIALHDGTIGSETLRRWYDDYRSGDSERIDILKSEIAIMLRRASATGWDELLPSWIEAVTPATKAATPLRYAVAMIRYALEHLSQPLRAEDIAEVVGLHPNYALSLFSSVMKVPLHKFVVRMRLIRARALLAEGALSIENVAFESGFPALSQFYAQFRNAYGMTPQQMRNSYLDRPSRVD
jgi:AraC family transcriptional regulator, melibiose operon regulatory protein